MNETAIVLAACEIVAEQLHTDTENIFRRTHQPGAVRARSLVLWLLRACTKWSLNEMSRAFSRAGGWEMDHSSILTSLERCGKQFTHAERVDLARELAERMGISRGLSVDLMTGPQCRESSSL